MNRADDVDRWKGQLTIRGCLCVMCVRETDTETGGSERERETESDVLLSVFPVLSSSR